MKRKVLVALMASLSILSFSCSSMPLSKQDAAIVGALGGAAVGAVAHKNFKTDTKTAAMYGAVAGGLLGYVAGNDTKSQHTVNAQTCYDRKTKDGKVIHICENWYQVDSQRIK